MIIYNDAEIQFIVSYTAISIHKIKTNHPGFIIVLKSGRL